MNIEYTVLLVVIAMHSLLGFVWYSPLFFGVQSRILSSILTSNEVSHESKVIYENKLYVWNALVAFVMALVLSNFINLLKINTVTDAIQLCFWLWFGFVAPTTFSGVLFSHVPRKLWLIQTGYCLVSLLCMGTIIVVMQ